MNSTCPPVSFNQAYNRADFINLWKNQLEYPAVEDLQLIYDPFRCFALPDFIAAGENNSDRTEEFLSSLRRELGELDHFEKHTDLYDFRQTKDLATFSDFPCIESFKRLFYGPIKEWMTKLTGVELTAQVDLTASAYGYTSNLLCHDDELDDRRIAFVLYLSPDWSPSDGGALELFITDEKNQPIAPVQAIDHKENMFVFFEVCPLSFHQVSEVFAKSKSRISINGWFHGPPIERVAGLVVEPLPIFNTPGFIPLESVMAWINPQYLDPSVQAQIRDHFQDESEIKLPGFLQEDKYQAVLDQLNSLHSKFKLVGPCNIRKIFKLDENVVVKNSPLSICLSLVRAEAFFVILSQLTGLDLHKFSSDELTSSDAEERDADDNVSKPSSSACPAVKNDSTDEVTGNEVIKKRRIDYSNGSSAQQDASTSDATTFGKCHQEIRLLKHGSYTLLHDSSNSKARLDVNLCFGSEDWQEDSGGYTDYVAKGETEPLLSIVPESNNLVLVYCESDTQKFLKYINCRSLEQSSSQYFDVNASFYECDEAN